MRPKAKDIDAYIEQFPAEVQKRLQQMRETIHKAAPQAEEKISYAIPTFTLNGNLVHFAGYERHVGFYPGALALAEFDDALTKYVRAKGSVQFPHVKPLPLALVARIVKFCVAQRALKAAKSRPKRARSDRGVGRENTGPKSGIRSV